MLYISSRFVILVGQKYWTPILTYKDLSGRNTLGKASKEKRKIKKNSRLPLLADKLFKDIQIAERKITYGDIFDISYLPILSKLPSFCVYPPPPFSSNHIMLLKPICILSLWAWTGFLVYMAGVGCMTFSKKRGGLALQFCLCVYICECLHRSAFSLRRYLSPLHTQ